MDLSVLVRTYAAALPEEEKGRAAELVAAAVHRARLKHASDWDRFGPAIEHLGRILFVNHALMPLDDYLETLYCAVKHADFAKSWRLTLKRPAAASPVE